jgi:uncharacterized membrane protein
VNQPKASLPPNQSPATPDGPSFTDGMAMKRQNRMSMRADHRSHLDLQINLLSEQEVTKVLQVLQRITRHLGIKDAIDGETQEFAQETEVDNLQRDLKATLKDKDPDSS